MNLNPALTKQEPSISVLIVTIVYIIYILLSKKISLKKNISTFQKEVLIKIYGILFFSCIPVITILSLFRQPVKEYGFNLPTRLYFIPISLGLFCLTLPVLYVHSKTDEGKRKYRELFDKNEPGIHIIYRILCWIFYIAGYEFCFRGFLLFSLYKTWGTLPALIISTSIYSFAHTSKGTGETVGSMIMGFIFGSIALVSRSFMPSFITHLFISITTDLILLLLYRKKEMLYNHRLFL